ncbi:hypothetical protein MNBD_ALPHA12-1733 [hydrothermal vent metagenome]|uniref:DUF721 domain-containing protein n=1 Tax=hydrothermal vent metagenome TaxID=652676 RepID=A0A3B0T7I5_9ZZZZ
MAPKKTRPTFKRYGKPVAIDELVAKVLGPHLKKRGFASRDLLTHWGVIAPAPYNKVSIPDRLVWQRNQEGAEGAILFVRCEEGQRLALTYDSVLIAAAINRYFGYLLVDTVKLSVEPFTSGSREKTHNVCEPNKDELALVEAELGDVEDEKLKTSLRKLGHGLFGARNS